MVFPRIGQALMLRDFQERVIIQDFCLAVRARECNSDGAHY